MVQITISTIKIHSYILIFSGYFLFKESKEGPINLFLILIRLCLHVCTFRLIGF